MTNEERRNAICAEQKLHVPLVVTVPANWIITIYSGGELTKWNFNSSSTKRLDAIKVIISICTSIDFTRNQLLSSSTHSSLFHESFCFTLNQHLIKNLIVYLPRTHQARMNVWLNTHYTTATGVFSPGALRMPFVLIYRIWIRNLLLLPTM